MRQSLRGLWRNTRSFCARTAAAGGFFATAAFALYNGFLGLRYSSLWHGSICVYYILLSVLRKLLFSAQKKAEEGAAPPPEQEKKLFSATAALLLTMNGGLAIPITLMVLDRRPIQTGLIPAIASAAYATYKLTAAAVRLKRATGGLFSGALRVIRFLDALVSILVLQNTLIVAVDGSVSQDMFYLSAFTSAGIFLLILAISLIWIYRTISRKRKAHREPSL